LFSDLEPITVTSTGFEKRSRFSGYAYVDADIVIGQVGFDEWTLSRPSEQFPGRQDGCYMSAIYENEQWKVGADFKGYCKIYIYRNGLDWAFSNSFSELVHVVRAQGWRVTPNEAQLDMWLPAPTFWQQLATFQTAVQEISLLPRQAELTASISGGLVWQSAVTAKHQENHLAYEDGVRDFVQIWLSRLLTVVEDESSQLEVELTGGRDSRTTLALVLGAKQMQKSEINERLTVISSKNHSLDLQCAEQISEQFGLRFNRPLPTMGQPQVKLAPYQRWYQFALGSYGPIVFPPASRRNGVFKIGGHGGEGHRGFYGYETLENPIKTHPNMRSQKTRAELNSAMKETESILAKEYPDFDPLVAHYKEFRDRLHSGLHSLNQVRMQPLSSHLLEEAMEFSGSEARERGQILFDIIGATAPHLMMMPFETLEKSPSKTILDQLLRPFEINLRVGKIYGRPVNTVASRSSWPDLLEAFHDADQTLSSDALAGDIRGEARSLANMLRRGESWGHARNSVPLHQVLLASLIQG